VWKTQAGPHGRPKQRSSGERKGQKLRDGLGAEAAGDSSPAKTQEFVLDRTRGPLSWEERCTARKERMAAKNDSLQEGESQASVQRLRSFEVSSQESACQDNSRDYRLTTSGRSGVERNGLSEKTTRGDAFRKRRAAGRRSIKGQTVRVGSRR